MGARINPSHPVSPQRSSRLPFAALLAALLFIPSCAAPATIPVIEPNQTFLAPDSRFETLGNDHIVIFTAPTGGWSARLDLSLRRFRIHEVYITLRKPEPGLPVSQAQIDHAVDTQIDASQNIAVYARVLIGREPGEAAPYRFVGEVIPDPPAR